VQNSQQPHGFRKKESRSLFALKEKALHPYAPWGIMPIKQPKFNLSYTKNEDPLHA
jgi:hypothetical protein